MALGITLVAAILVIAGVIFYQKVHYQNRWYQNTFINDVDVSGQTLEESRKSFCRYMTVMLLPSKAGKKDI